MNAVVQVLEPSVELACYDRMCHAIAVCHRIDEAKKIRDKAEALRAYARQAQNRDAEIQLAEIKVRAERRCGELLKEMADSGERAMPRDKSGTKAKLIDLGLHRSESSRYQQIAALPASRFEAHLAACKERGRPVTSMGLRTLAVPSRDSAPTFLTILVALETISMANMTAAQWIGKCTPELRNRAMLALSCAGPWIEQLDGAAHNSNAAR